MKNNTAEKKDVLASSVKIVDGKIILSLPNAKMPVVWQMDIEKAQSAAFTIQEDKKKKNYALLLKKQDGEIDEIAVFDSKESAVEVLMETSEALQNAQGQIKGATMVSANPANSNNGGMASSSKSSKEEGGDKLGAFLAVSLVIVLILIWTVSSSVPEKISEVGGTSVAGGNVDARQSAGVPVSADDFLSKR